MSTGKHLNSTSPKVKNSELTKWGHINKVLGRRFSTKWSTTLTTGGAVTCGPSEIVSPTHPLENVSILFSRPYLTCWICLAEGLISRGVFLCTLNAFKNVTANPKWHQICMKSFIFFMYDVQTVYLIYIISVFFVQMRGKSYRRRHSQNG